MNARKQVIVCGIDGSAAGQRALEWAIDEASRRDCQLRVVTAWWWDGVESFGATSTPQAARLHAQEIQDIALTRALDGTENALQVERLLVRGGASDALTAATLDAELLVLGSHGHGAAHDKFVGSTSQRAIHHASCPVVLLPDPRRSERVLKRAKARHRSAEVPYSTPMF